MATSSPVLRPPSWAADEAPPTVVEHAGTWSGTTTVMRLRTTIVTRHPTELIDITDLVQELCRTHGPEVGQALIFCAHTTCGLLLNEHEEGFFEDLLSLLENHASRDQYWAHDDLTRRWQNLNEDERPNGHSHVRAAMVAHPSLMLPIQERSLALGQWQRILFLELDGPRNRTVTLELSGVVTGRDPVDDLVRKDARDDRVAVSVETRSDDARGQLVHAATAPRSLESPGPPSSADGGGSALAQRLAREFDLPSLPDDYAGFERALDEGLRAEDEFMSVVASHLSRAGGKRVRPLLALLAGHAAEDGRVPLGDRVFQGAVMVELMHLGTLYHDDVIDDAATRRGVASANASWGSRAAIMAGDFLLARAAKISAMLGAVEAHMMGKTFADLCEGQTMELRRLFDPERPEEEYLRCIALKTAALLETAAHVGALEAGLPADGVEALARFGYHTGMAFQLIDDVLDLIGTDSTLGKPAGHDLLVGVYTLPVIHALRTSDDLRTLLASPLQPDDVERARAIVHQEGGVDVAVALAQRHVDDAVRCLRLQVDRCPKMVRIMTTLVEELAERKS